MMIGYFEDDRRVVTMAMNGWLNVQAHPEATLAMVGGVTLPVVGRRAEGAERDRWWDRWRELDDGLDGYAARRPAETAVVVFERRDA